MLCFLCAWTTQILGVHAMFGGFAFGVAVPRINQVHARIGHRIEDLVVSVLLPLYFTFSGLRTQFNTLSDGTAWGMVFLVILAAVTGKSTQGMECSALLGHLPHVSCRPVRQTRRLHACGESIGHVMEGGAHDGHIYELQGTYNKGHVRCHTCMCSFFPVVSQGLVELIVLNVGLDLGVLTPKLFSIFVFSECPPNPPSALHSTKVIKSDASLQWLFLPPS